MTLLLHNPVCRCGIAAVALALVTTADTLYSLSNSAFHLGRTLSHQLERPRP